MARNNALAELQRLAILAPLGCSDQRLFRRAPGSLSRIWEHYIRTDLVDLAAVAYPACYHVTNGQGRPARQHSFELAAEFLKRFAAIELD